MGSRQNSACSDQKLYLSPILDLFSRDIISYTIFDRPGLALPTQKYQQMLNAKGTRQRMSRKGICLDNAVIENFFGLLKSELVYL